MPAVKQSVEGGGCGQHTLVLFTLACEVMSAVTCPVTEHVYLNVMAKVSAHSTLNIEYQRVASNDSSGSGAMGWRGVLPACLPAVCLPACRQHSGCILLSYLEEL